MKGDWRHRPCRNGLDDEAQEKTELDLILFRDGIVIHHFMAASLAVRLPTTVKHIRGEIAYDI